MSQPNSALPAPRLIAILAADAAGYTRLMSIDDRLTVELLDSARTVFRHHCAEHQGRVVDMAGDSVLLAFDSASSALRCAMSVQQQLAAQSHPQTGTLRLPFRIGLHLGDVIEKSDGSVYGEGVNLAARLQTLAEPDEVMVSQPIRDLLATRSLARFEDAGEHQLKNVAEPVRAWRALPPGDAAGAAEAAPARYRDSLRFDHFELQPTERRLLVDGVPAALGARAFDLLLALVEQPGALVTKNQLIERAWPGLVVEEHNLATQINSLRKLLGGDVIATIPGRGYRFMAGIESGAAAPTPAAAPPEAAKLQTNLPATLPPLVGRSEDLAALNELVAQHRLVSIIGAGGMGKTTVALHLTAQRQAAYRHGVCWVELAALADPEALAAAIAAAIGVRIGNGDPIAGLCTALMPLSMLVVLDNAEQVVDGVARVVQAVLDKAPELRFVVTTQVPLKLPAERAYRIGTLAVPQGALPPAQALEFGAIALFVERAQAADARFALTDANAPAVIELCRQLDGVALAIELAAARAPMLGVARLATSMGDRLKVLTSSRNRVAPARQQTLRAALEWSHGFLEPPEQAVFRRLSVFAGSGSLEMIQQVVADPPGEGELDEWAVLDSLALLVDRSLVIAMTTDDDAPPRYRLLETPRLFAHERLQQAGEEVALRRRHAHAIAARFEAAHDELESGSVGVETWRQAISADVENGREALAWTLDAGDAHRAARIASTQSRAIPPESVGERIALTDLMEPLFAQIDDARSLVHLSALVIRTLADTQRTRAAVLTRELCSRALAMVQTPSAEHRWLRHRAHALLVVAECRAGNLEAAQSALAEARELVDAAWPPVKRFDWIQAELFVATTSHDWDALQRWTRTEIENTKAFGSTRLNSNLIDTELAVGNAAKAASMGWEMLKALESSRDEQTLVFVRLNLSAALLALDQPEHVPALLRAAWNKAPLFAARAYVADYLTLLAALQGRAHDAARLAGYGDATNTRLGEREPNEAAAVERASRLAREALGDAEFDRLHAEGALLGDAAVEALAFPEPAPAAA